MTQTELAEKAGVSADMVAKVEKGFRKPRPSSIRKLAGALEVEVEQLTAGAMGRA